MKKKQIAKIFTFSLTIIGALLGTFVISVIFLVFIFFSVIGKNASVAKNEAKPINQAMKQMGWKFICDYGGGDGLDSAPWYGMFYEMADSPELVTQIKEISKNYGYTLVTDNAYIAELQDKQQYDPKTDYFRGRNTQEHKLFVSVRRNEKVTLSKYCGTSHKDMTPAPGQAIVGVEIQTAK